MNQPSASGNRTNAVPRLLVPGWVFWCAALLLLAGQTAVVILSGVSVPALAGLEAMFLVVCIAYIMTGRIRYRRSVESFNESETQLQDTRLKLTAFNDHMHALHAFTHRLVDASDAAELASTTTRSLVERFLFDSAQIWVRDGASGRLQCLSRHGYSAVVERMIFTTESGKPHENLVGFLEDAIQRNQSVVVANAGEESSQMPADLLRFIRSLDISSCVITTLYDENRPIGILSAERKGTLDVDTKDVNLVRSISQAAMGAIARGELRRLDEIDRHLVESITTVVKTALVKLELFRSMEERIEQRTRDLRETQKALLDAKEMVIQSEKLSSLGRMAAGVIHEINDPLNFLVNILPDVRKDFEGLARARHLILSAVTDPAVRAEIDRIGREADLDAHLQDLEFVFSRAIEAVSKSTRIAKGLVVFSRGAQKEEVEEVDLLEAARNTANLIPAKRRGQTTITVEETAGVVWRLNRGQFEQVIMNLLTNAIDAMDQGGSVTVRGRVTGQGVEVRVSDTGPGIPDTLRTRIFEPFFTTKPAGSSTGLGLSISGEIVRKFGGFLTVDPASATGATFVISFRQQVHPKPSTHEPVIRTRI